MIRASFAAKALSIIFFIAMMLSIAPLAWAESSGGFEYTVLDGKATITKYTGTSAVVVVPSEINGYPVEAIGDSAFYPNAANLVTSITIPDSVSSIGAQAFYQCARLSSVTIPNSVTSIGNGAFQDCRSLRSVYLPESLESIGEKLSTPASISSP